MSITTLKKPPRITTTVRFDPDLKNRAEQFAQLNHMDFTTFLHFSVETTMKNGGRIEPVWQVSPAYAKKLEEIDRQIEAYDRGELKAYGPFSTKEENQAFLESMV
jgi:hypothetical protein